MGEVYNLLEAGNARQTMLLLEQNRSCIAAVVLDITTDAAKQEATILREDLLEFLDEIPIIVITDISAAKRDQEQLQRRLEQYEIILAQTENVLFTWDIEKIPSIFRTPGRCCLCTPQRPHHCHQQPHRF